MRERLHFLLLNIGHFLDHLFTLIFATVAALALYREWSLGYGDLIKYATPGFFAFGVFALPAGWLADKWSREGMMATFFIGIGLASLATSFSRTPLEIGLGLFALPAGWLADKWSREGMMCVFFFGVGLAAIATGFAQSPLQIGIGLFVIGMFAAIYHPVGLAIVTAKWKNTGMRIAVNGVWGNLGVASAALLTGYFIDHGGWRAAFIVPGAFAIAIGIAYVVLRWPELRAGAATAKAAAKDAPLPADYKALLLRISAIVFVTAAVSSVIFQSTTFALPKIFDERMQGVAGTLAQWLKDAGLSSRVDIATMVGAFAFIVFAVASMAQLVVGSMLDRFGPAPVFMTVAAMQVVFFGLMPGLHDGLALAVALGFMLGAFGQIPINDYMIGKMASASPS